MSERLLCVRGSCNLSCLFCVYGKKVDRAVDPVAHQREVEAELDRLQGTPARLAWGGGDHEPTTFAGLPELMRSASRRGIPRQRLHTNGIRTADPAYLDELRQCGLTSVVISIAGYDSGSADLLCGATGVLAAKLATIDNCRRAGIEIAVNLLLMRANYQQVEAMLALCLPHLDGELVSLIPITHTEKGLSEWFLAPLSGVLQRASRAAARWPRRTLDLHDIPECIRAGRALPPNLRFRSRRRGEFAPGCAACEARAACPGLMPGYLEAYGAQELDGGTVLHRPVDLVGLQTHVLSDRKDEFRGPG